MTDQEQKEKARELWESRIHSTATYIQRQTGAGAVMVAIFDAPWMAGAEPATIGLTGTPKTDMFRIARDLRDLATMIEAQAGNIDAGGSWTVESERTPPGGQ